MAQVLPHRYALIDVGEISQHPENPRRGDLDAIAASIESNGFFGALVVHEPTGHILIGNHRWEAAKAAGLSRLPALLVDCDEDAARRILLADNRTAELARWDDAALLALLNDLAVTPAGLAGSSFDAADLARLAGRWHDPDLDDIPEPPGEPVTGPGDLWELDGHRLLCGDSTRPEDVGRLMGAEQARLLVTDPPYLVGYTGGQHPSSKHNRAVVKDKLWDTYHEGGETLYADFLAAVVPRLAAGTPVYQWHAELRRPAVVAAWQEAGLLVHQVLYWVKSRPVLTHAHFAWQTEPCLYGWRKGSQPVARRRPPAGTPNVWTLDQKSANAEHPTEKPVRLFADPASWHLRGGEIMLDPFCGSGTAVIAAERTGRRCFALEVEPRYVDVACARWQALTGRKPQRDGRPHDFGTAGGA